MTFLGMSTVEGDNRSWMVTVLEMYMIKVTANGIRIMTLDCDHPRDCRVTSDIEIGGLNIRFLLIKIFVQGGGIKSLGVRLLANIESISRITQQVCHTNCWCL